jgi:hypothetical protein
VFIAATFPKDLLQKYVCSSFSPLAHLGCLMEEIFNE